MVVNSSCTRSRLTSRAAARRASWEVATPLNAKSFSHRFQYGYPILALRCPALGSRLMSPLSFYSVLRFPHTPARVRDLPCSPIPGTLGILFGTL